MKNFQGSHDGVWECPDLIDMGNGDFVLIVSIGDNGSSERGSITQVKFFTIKNHFKLNC